MVCFTGDRAYKLKKPVDLGVTEVRDLAGQTCDRLVVMRRLPAGRLGAPRLAEAAAVARQLLSMTLKHLRAATANGTLTTPAGEPGTPTQQALSAIRPHGPEHTWRPTRPYMLPG